MVFDISHFDGIRKTPHMLLKEHFKIKSLEEVHDKKFKSNKTKGIDRISGEQFSKQATSQIRVINKKCLNGTYRFSPYLELLATKGRGKAPRVLAIPTIRDRIVLHSLKEILFKIFPECKPRRLANTYINDIKIFLKDSGKGYSEISVIRTDIATFYDSIDRKILFKQLKQRIKSRRILALIQRAIETPTVPKNYHRKEIHEYYNSQGIPQGLSISNILASIYLHQLDSEMEKVDGVNVYYRYVDDILIFANKENIDEIEKIFRNKIKSLNLEINEKKTNNTSLDNEFEYLGYRFELPKITVKKSTIEKYIHSIAAKFTSYTYNRDKTLSKLKKFNKGLKHNQLVEKLKEIFIEELNEKITGAINEKRRYGSLFYFSAINDESILYNIDNIVKKLFNRLDDFGKSPPSDLKKISRAFYEAIYNPKGGYIHNYNNYITIEDKTKILKRRGKLESDKPYSNEEINELYEKLKQRSLSDLDKDDAFLY